jgi:DNA-binding GntR family transcriptional regulator
MSKSSELVYQMLREKIISGEVEPGSQLREEEVAEWCGVSRTPVRDAIKQLEAEMFIWRSESQRSFVAAWTLSDIEDLFTIRGMLEALASGRAATRATDETVARLERINCDIRIAVDRPTPDIDAFLVSNQAFHALILEMSASQRLAEMLTRVILRPIVQRTAMRYDPAQLERSLSEHEELTAAISRRDAEWASSLMSAHIRRAFHIYVDILNGDPATVLADAAQARLKSATSAIT